jgi:hypothetical protein
MRAWLIALAAFGGAQAALFGCGEDGKEAASEVDGPTAFGVARSMMVDDLSGEDKRAYCAWILEKVGGAGAVIACPVYDDSGAPMVDADAGAPVERTYHFPTTEACVESDAFAYPCTAGVVEACYDSWDYDVCAEAQASTEACDALRACSREGSAPTNETCRGSGCLSSSCCSTACAWCENSSSESRVYNCHATDIDCGNMGGGVEFNIGRVTP